MTMTSFSKKNSDYLEKLISQQLELLEKYLVEVSVQTEYIQFDDDEGLTLSLQAQGEIVKELDKLHKKTAPLIVAYQKSPQASDDSCYIGKALTRIKAILKESSELNEQNLKSAAEKKAEYSELINKLKTDQKGISGYKQQITETSDLFDKKQ